jgi:outer membrane protein insertion porin family
VKRWLMVAVALGAVRTASAQTGTTPERTVTSVSFRGNHAIDALTLSEAIVTSASSWAYSVPLLKDLGFGVRREFDELDFRRDVVRLQILYRLHGYFEARIDTVVTRSGSSVAIRFLITEGPPVVVDSITVQGLGGVLDTSGLLRKLPLTEGKPFDRTAFDDAADTIAQVVQDRGYPFVAVYRNYAVDRGARTASVDYQVVPGPRARVGEIRIVGNRGVSAPTIRRFLAVRPGDWFSRSALYDSQRSLYESDLFRYASVGLAPDSTVGGADSLVRILVQVSEGPKARVRAGVGYGTIDCFRSQATLSMANFLGGGRRLDLAGKLSKLGVGAPTDWGLANSLCSALQGDSFSVRTNYFASATFTQPAVFSRRNTVTLTTFGERRSEYKAFERNDVGATLGTSFALGRASVLGLSYRLTYGSTTANAAVFCIYFDRCDPTTVNVLEQRRRQAALALSVVRNTQDSPLEPTTGSVLSFEVTHASPLVGSDSLISYNKVVGEGTWYVPVVRDWVLALRLRGGLIRPGRAFVNDTSIRFVPPEERFYAGGPSSVRGFGRNEMGPVVYVADSIVTDPTTHQPVYYGLRTSPTGSYAIALGNVELRVPAPVWSSRLRLALFVDAGQLWNQTAGGLAPGGVRVTPGVGLRLGTPLGPVRVDVAYNGYPAQQGPLYVVTADSTGARTQLTLQPGQFAGLPRGNGFFQRLQFQFSVGEAY